MTLVLTFCMGILGSSPGCVIDRVKLLDEVTPQMCIIKAQEKIASEIEKYPGYKLRAFGCERKV